MRKLLDFVVLCKTNRNSVLDGLKNNFFEFIQESMSEKVFKVEMLNGIGFSLFVD